jgi:cell wall-associated NlpC family hydrolase
MKWIIGILIFVFAGWKAAVYFANNDATASNFSNTDSLQAKQLVPTNNQDSVEAATDEPDALAKDHLSLSKGSVDTKGVNPQQVVAFAKTLIGVPYLYGSTDPAKGFDCSGFITHVFQQFNIEVPRSSIDFTNVGKEVSATQAKEGDLILFTGTDSADHFVGHMGIVVSNTDTLRFIHSTSGKQYGVTITPLNNYYKGRYVKTVRIFP